MAMIFEILDTISCDDLYQQWPNLFLEGYLKYTIDTEAGSEKTIGWIIMNPLNISCLMLNVLLNV